MLNLYCILSGVLSGIVIWASIHFGSQLSHFGAIYFIIPAVLYAQLANDENKLKRTSIIAICFGLLFLALFYLMGQNEDKIPWLIVTSVLIFYILTPFLQIWNQSGISVYPYPELFKHSWNNFFILLIAAAILGIFWGLLWLCIALFNMIKIEFFANVFLNPKFYWIASTAVMGLGISIAKQNSKIIYTLRHLVLSICKLFLPLAAVIIIMFVCVLPFCEIQNLYKEHISRVFIALISIFIFLINSVVQHGTIKAPFNKIITMMINLSIILSLAFIAMPIYGLGVRIVEHGLTPLRFTGAIVILMLAIYICSYVMAVFRSKDYWLDKITVFNPCLAMLVVITAIAMNTPLLDPYGFSARTEENIKKNIALSL